MAFIITKDEKNQSVPDLQQLKSLIRGAQPPINVREIAEKLGLSITEDMLMDSEISGCLENKGGKWYISVNAFHSEKRKRFTIAHEIAHYILHSTTETTFKDISFFRSPSSDKMEIEANRLAAKILMPEEMFLEEIKKGNNTILSLAETFNVSGSASQYRAKSLGLLK